MATRSKGSVQDLMTQNPDCCTPQTSLREVAKMMVKDDCGSIPVVENQESRQLIGIVTDRDIVCRTIAQDKNPLEAFAEVAMSQPVVSIRPETSIKECLKLMEENMVRRLPVIDDMGRCIGMVSQGQLARRGELKDVAHMVKQVSQKTEESSRAAA
jgi:CBS domain-containing protein